MKIRWKQLTKYEWAEITGSLSGIRGFEKRLSRSFHKDLSLYVNIHMKSQIQQYTPVAKDLVGGD